MKQRELLNRFLKNGWWVFREGGNHTIVTDGKDVEAIPRHKEISENLAKSLIKRRNLK